MLTQGLWHCPKLVSPALFPPVLAVNSWCVCGSGGKEGTQRSCPFIPGKAPLRALVIKNMVHCRVWPSPISPLWPLLPHLLARSTSGASAWMPGCLSKQRLDLGLGLLAQLLTLPCRQSGAWHPRPPAFSCQQGQAAAKPAKRPPRLPFVTTSGMSPGVLISGCLQTGKCSGPSRASPWESGEPAEQSGLCLHSVWTSQTRPACLSELRLLGNSCFSSPPSTALTTAG